MQRRILVWVQLSALLCAGKCAAAIPTQTAWEVRTTGSDLNGGGFVAGASGTDRSQANAAFCTSADLAVVTTTATSVSCPFSAASVGNIIQITAGGCSAGFYQVVSVAVVTATFDRSAGTASGCTFALGGALATIGKALAPFVSGNIIFVKATGTYVITANLVLLPNLTPTNTSPPNQIAGYTTTRTDGGQATVQLSTNANLKAFDGSNAGGWYISNIIADCNSLGTSTGFYMNASSVLRNVVAKNCTSIGAYLVFNNSLIIDSELTLNSGTGALVLGGTASAERCYIHDNTTIGVTLNVGSAIAWSVIANNTGATSDGIDINNQAAFVHNNTIYANGRDGIRGNNNGGIGVSSVRNNLIVSNVGFGFNGYVTIGWGSFGQYDGNAYFSNTAGNRTNSNDTGSTNPINADNPYTTSLDVILSANPFTNAGAHDFTLNSTAGGGAAAKGTATPGAIPGLSQTGNMSFGALQPTTAAAVVQSASAFVQ